MKMAERNFIDHLLLIGTENIILLAFEQIRNSRHLKCVGLKIFTSGNEKLHHHHD